MHIFTIISYVYIPHRSKFGLSLSLSFSFLFFSIPVFFFSLKCEISLCHEVWSSFFPLSFVVSFLLLRHHHLPATRPTFLSLLAQFFLCFSHLVFIFVVFSIGIWKKIYNIYIYMQSIIYECKHSLSRSPARPSIQ